MTTFDGAVIREQGITFGVVSVKPHVVANVSGRDAAVRAAERAFGGIPTILLAASSSRPRYYGRPDLVRFMARVPLQAIPWKRYTI